MNRLRVFLLVCLALTLVSGQVSANDNPVTAKPTRVIQGYFAQRTFKLAKTKVRPHQGRFRFKTLKQYGIGCAVCGIQQEALLEAAHLCPVEKGGSDDPRNGLVFCLTHHRAFDKGLFGIDPETLRIEVRPPCQSPGELAITRESIAHLQRPPHREALEWAWVGRTPKRH